MSTALPAAGTGAWPDGLPYEVVEVLADVVVDVLAEVFVDVVVVVFDDVVLDDVVVALLDEDVAEAFAAAAAAAAARFAARECRDEVCVAVPVDVPLAAGGTVAVTPLSEAAAGATAFTACTADVWGTDPLPQPARAAATAADRTRKAPGRLCTAER